MGAPFAGLLHYGAIRRQLFRIDPEHAHEWAIAALENGQLVGPVFRALTRRFRVDDARLAQTIWGLRFANPVGLAAGFDKNARVIHGLAALGFGFIEVGTVTPKPQSGNPRPRIWRLAEEESLQNALGFNNDGMAAIGRRLREQRPFPVPVGVNLGKNKDTPPEGALEDYVTLLEHLHDAGDYFVINVSSPNTPGLRDYQNEAFVRQVFAEAKRITDKPVLLKVAPDGDVDAIVALTEAAVNAGAAGIIATNTTVDYQLIPGIAEKGGLSGGVLREKSYAVFRAIAARLAGKTVLISVGGIDTGEEAQRRIDVGANLVQVYTGLIYKGPGLPRRICLSLGRGTNRCFLKT